MHLLLYTLMKQVDALKHHRCLRHGLLLKSAVSEHQLETGNQIIVHSASVVAKSSNYLPSKICEITKSIKHNFTNNHEALYLISLVWNTVHIVISDI